MKSEILCKICQNRTEIWKDKKFDTNYFYCSKCKYIFLDEEGIVSEEKERCIYKNHDNTVFNSGYVNMFKEFINHYTKPQERGIKKALDFGAGPGPVLAVLLRRMGLEVDIYDIYFAPRKVFKDKKYDLVTATEVYEHLKNPLETTRFIKKHLNKEGILAIMTLFHPDDYYEFNEWWYRRDPTHISFYRPQTFEYLAEKCNLKFIECDEKNKVLLKKIN